MHHGWPASAGRPPACTLQPATCVLSHQPCENSDGISPLQLRALCVAAGDSSQPGTVTAGNASVIADGAAALVLVSAERASELGLRVSGPKQNQNLLH